MDGWIDRCLVTTDGKNRFVEEKYLSWNKIDSSIDSLMFYSMLGGGIFLT